MKPLLKWVGGKTQLLPEIRKRYPNNFGSKIKKYAEPFVGGGAVLFDILKTYQLNEVYISDINSELINLYKDVKNNSNELIEYLKLFQTEYMALSDEKRKTYYLEKREKFNTLKLQKIKNPEISALFIFLNKTCFNGLYRVNKKGYFNVPMGKYKNPLIYSENIIKNASNALQNVEIIEGNYKSLDKFIDETTFVYFDPPYRPLNITSNFTSYSEHLFNDESQIQLAEYVKELNNRGVKFLLSNSDPKNTNPDDNFFDELYADFKIERVYASRVLNSNGDGRGKISEILVRN